MGDVRYDRFLDELREAPDRVARLRDLTDEEVVQALAACARARDDPYLTNVLATEALNRTRRANVVFQHMTEGAYAYDASGVVTAMNRAAERALGWTREEVVGRSIHDTLHRHHPRRAWIESVCSCRRPFLTKREDHELVQLFRQDGSTFPATCHAVPVPGADRVVVTFEDLSLTRRLEREREAWRRLLQTLYHAHDDLGEGLVVVEDSRVTYANDALRRLLGRSLESFRSVDDAFELVSDESRAEARARFAAVVSGERKTARFCAALVRADGRTVDVEVAAARVPPEPGGAPARFVLVVRPVSPHAM